MIFENLSRSLSSAPTTAAKAAISRAAELSIARHAALAAEIERASGTVADAMEPYVVPVDIFERDTRGGDWYESLITEVKDDGLFVLKWRDWPDEPPFLRRAHQLGLLPIAATVAA